MIEDENKAASPDRAEGGNDTPSPEKGSPGAKHDDDVDDASARRTEQGVDTDANPLAPPINNQPGS